MARFGRLGRFGEMPPGGMQVAPSSGADRNADYERYTQGRRFKFSYQTPSILSLAAAGVATVVIQFDLDSVFCWLRTTVFADIAGAAITSDAYVVPLVTALITDTGSGQAFMNAPIPLGALAGNGPLPYVEPTPQFIQPNTSLQFQFANFSAATTYANLRVQLHGFKIYGSAPPAQL